MAEVQLSTVAEKVRQDPAWMEKFAATETKDEWLGVAVEAARAHGVETTPAEIEAFMQNDDAGNGAGDHELSDQELQHVVAGAGFCCAV